MAQVDLEGVISPSKETSTRVVDFEGDKGWLRSCSLASCAIARATEPPLAISALGPYLLELSCVF